VDALGDNYRWTFLFATLFMALAWITMRYVKEIIPSKKEAELQPAAE